MGNEEFPGQLDLGNNVVLQRVQVQTMGAHPIMLKSVKKVKNLYMYVHTKQLALSHILNSPFFLKLSFELNIFWVSLY